MSGMIFPAKRKEFEQTFRFVFNLRIPDCLQYTLSVDIFTPNQFHFYSLWVTLESLKEFSKSQEFQLLKGAFQTLGSLESETAGELVDIKAFHITDVGIYSNANILDKS
jgi:quinol monooxygenase YgiN